VKLSRQQILGAIIIGLLVLALLAVRGWHLLVR